EETSRLSREHAVSQSVAGLITVAGGKYTTSRVMARDAVDAAARQLPGSVAPSCTDRTPLVGAEGFASLWNRRARLAAEWSLEPARGERPPRGAGGRAREGRVPGRRAGARRGAAGARRRARGGSAGAGARAARARPAARGRGGHARRRD